MSPFLDTERLHEHRVRNLWHTAVLVSAISFVTMLCAWLIASWMGALLALVGVCAVLWFAPRIQPDAIMRMYRARPLDPRAGAQLAHLVEVLADRAELRAEPRLYIVPSLALNAFAAGAPDHAAIAVTEGLLRRLDLREIAGVLAHEMSHIRNNDLFVMSIADAMSRLTHMFSYVAVALAILNLPGLLVGESPISWTAIAILYLAPAASSLLQLALSRTREYDADQEAATLTGDPRGLASALGKLEQYQGQVWEELTFPVPARRVPHPSLLRTHPTTEERIARLRSLESLPNLKPVIVVEEPMVSLVGFSPTAMRPRYRWTGLWY
jgi:heat shock protein HtpX